MGDVMRVPGLSEDEFQALNTNLDRMIKHRPHNFRRSCLYDGKNAGERMSSVVPAQYHKLGIALGWSGKAIDSLNRRTFIEDFSWAGGSLEDLGFDEFSRENFLRSEVSQSLTDSSLHGISFLITTRGQDGEPDALVHARDALNCSGTWNPRVRRLTDALSVAKWSQEDDKRPDEFTLYMDGVTVTASREGGKWSVDRSEHSLGVPVEPLVYKPRPSRRYGQSRLTRPIIGLHMQAVRELIRLEGHMDIYSYPEFWLLGGDMSAFKNADGSQKAVWQVMLGRVKGLQDDPNKPESLMRPDVKQFPAASPAPHGDALDILSRAFAREASLPDSAVALRGTSNPTSADAYDASQYELISEAEGAMADWTPTLTRTIARALAIKNGLSEIPSEFFGIEPSWRGARYETQASKADAGLKQLSAVPWLAETQVGLELVGLSEQQIKRALSEKRRADGRAVLDALANAAQQPPVTQPPQDNAQPVAE